VYVIAKDKTGESKVYITGSTLLTLVCWTTLGVHRCTLRHLLKFGLIESALLKLGFEPSTSWNTSLNNTTFHITRLLIDVKL
jgi:hypothetical protein